MIATTGIASTISTGMTLSTITMAASTRPCMILIRRSIALFSVTPGRQRPISIGWASSSGVSSMLTRDIAADSSRYFMRPLVCSICARMLVSSRYTDRTSSAFPVRSRTSVRSSSSSTSTASRLRRLDDRSTYSSVTSCPEKFSLRTSVAKSRIAVSAPPRLSAGIRSVTLARSPSWYL